MTLASALTCAFLFSCIWTPTMGTDASACSDSSSCPDQTTLLQSRVETHTVDAFESDDADLGNMACGFESSSKPYCGLWDNVKGDRFDWSRKSGKTPSGNTGPDKANEGKYYLYIETSCPRRTNDNAILQTNKEVKIESGATLKFDYHMKGSAINTLKVLVFGQKVADVVFEKKNAQGNNWNTASVDLAKYDGQKVKVAFEANRGKSWSGDIAIDNVKLDTGKSGGGGGSGGTGKGPAPATTGAPPSGGSDLTKKVDALQSMADQIIKMLKSYQGR